MLERAVVRDFDLPPQNAHQPACEPAILAAALQMSLQQGGLLCVLLAQSLTTTRIVEQRTGLTAEGRRTMIHRLRSRLERSKIRIISHPGLGYSVPPEDRARIFAIVERFNGRSDG